MDLDTIDELICVGAPNTDPVWGALPSMALRRFVPSTVAALQAASHTLHADPHRVIAVLGVSTGMARHNHEVELDLHHRLTALTLERQYNYTVDSYYRATECNRQGDFRSEIIPVYIRPPLQPPRWVTVDELRCTRVRVENLPPGWNSFEYADIGSRTATAVMSTILMSRTRTRSEGRAVQGLLHDVDQLSDGPARLYPPPTVFQAATALLDRHHLSADELDHIEVAEDSASTPLAWCAALQLRRDLVNPRGGALALGDCGPADGLRALSTALVALRDTGGRYGLVVCEGSDGTGALLFERPSASLVGSQRQRSCELLTRHA